MISVSQDVGVDPDGLAPQVGDSVPDNVIVVIVNTEGMGILVDRDRELLRLFARCNRVLHAGSTDLTRAVELGELASMSSNWCRSRSPGYCLTHW